MTNKKLPNIEHLVLSGAGHGLFSYLGAFSVLIKHKIIDIKKIKTIYGTSAGSIVSVFILLDIDIDIIIDYAVERPWNEVFKLDNNLINIITDYGICDDIVIKKIFSPLFSMKDIDINITMIEFYEKTNVELYFYGTELKTFEETELSYKNTPNLKLLDAVYISSSLPILFKPMVYNTKYYIDGGFINQYPIENILKNIDNDNTIFGIKNLPEHTFEKFGELNNYEIQQMKKEDKLYKNEEDDNTSKSNLNIITILQTIMLNILFKSIEPHKSNLFNELEIKSSGILTVDNLKKTIISYDHRLELINRAKKETEDFIKLKYGISL